MSNLSKNILTNFFLITTVLLTIFILSCQVSSGYLRDPGIPQIPDKKNISSQTDIYALVGSSSYEFSSINDALAGLGDRKTIVIIDAVHTESGIIIDKDITIIGYGSEKTIIRSAETATEALDRIIEINEGVEVLLYNLTISNGRPAAMLRRGGGILNFGNLEIVNCVIRDNEAMYGAGISTHGNLTMRNSTVSGNRAVRFPGPEMNSGFGCLGSGAGIKTEKGAVLQLYGCSIINNSTFRRGGGLYVACETSAYLENCTISGNSSIRAGAGINSRGDLTLVYCTITDNEAGRNGGGLFNYGHLDMVATIISENRQSDFEEGDGGLGYYGKGIIGINRFNFVSDGSFPDAIYGDPGLKKLNDYGGSTLTHALKLQSPAVDALPSDILLTFLSETTELTLPITDQRGKPRAGNIDIGAYER